MYNLWVFKLVTMERKIQLQCAVEIQHVIATRALFLPLITGSRNVLHNPVSITERGGDIILPSS